MEEWEALIGLGLMLLATSYLYIRYRQVIGNRAWAKIEGPQW